MVIPVVARHVGGGRQREASQTVSALITWTLLALTPAALAAFAGSALYSSVFATQCEGSASTIAALLIMFVPQIWFYGLAVVSAGVLQAHHRFLAAALAPLLSSVVVITAYLIFAGISGPAALWVLGLGTTLGVVALALTTAVPLFRLGLRIRPRLRFAAGDREVVTRIAAAGIAGLVLQQVSVLLINYAAQRSLDPGALTRYTWANAIYLLPYAVLAAPLLQLAFPRLAAAADSDAGEVRRVLAEFLPLVTTAAWLGAALLIATAVPVARVFVLGPGSGRTGALAWPIALFAPAVVGFALLGLASRTLLAQHRARDAGLATISGWAAVIIGVLSFGRTVPLLAAAMSAGLGVGAVVGWILVRRSAAIALGGPLGRPMLAGLLAAVAAAGAVVWPSRQLADAGLVAATAGAFGLALLCAMIFVGVLRLVEPRLVAELWARLPGRPGR